MEPFKDIFFSIQWNLRQKGIVHTPVVFFTPLCVVIYSKHSYFASFPFT